jgi:hypothetical protein
VTACSTFGATRAGLRADLRGGDLRQPGRAPDRIVENTNLYDLALNRSNTPRNGHQRRRQGRAAATRTLFAHLMIERRCNPALLASCVRVTAATLLRIANVEIASESP